MKDRSVEVNDVTAMLAFYDIFQELPVLDYLALTRTHDPWSMS